MALYSGKCSRCGREYYEDHKDSVVCDCWETCPICGATMEPYPSDLAANTYAKGEMLTLRVCTNHNPPFFSKQKPVEVELTEQ